MTRTKFRIHSHRYISNIQMAGGKVVYVPLRPPPSVAMKRSSAADWTLDLPDLEKAMSERTKMLVGVSNCVSFWLLC